MKIAITGAAGTGKTTLAKLIADNTDLSFMRDWMNVWLDENGYESGNALFDSKGIEGIKKWYVGALERKMSEDSTWQNFISDKSVLDHAGRWLAKDPKWASDKEHEQYRMLVEKGIGVYNKIIFLPLTERQVIDDGQRNTDYNHRYKVDLILRGLIDKFKPQVQIYDYDFKDSPEKVLKDLSFR